MQFVARYLDSQQHAVLEREFDAASQEDLLRQLEREGHLPIAVRSARSRRELRRSAFDLRSFAIELRSLLLAGLGVVAAMEALCAAQRSDGDGQVLRGVLDRVRTGKSLSVAMEPADLLFPALFRAAIRAGESSGQLPESLDRYATYLEVMARLRRSVIGAAIYPAVVTSFGLAVLLFLLGYVVPRFALAYEALPPRTAGPGLLLQTATLVSEHFALVLAGLIALVWLGWRGLVSERGSAAALTAVLKIRQVAHAVRAFHFARLYRSMSMMLDGGHTVLQAIGLAKEVLRGTPWRVELNEVETMVANGKGLAMSLVNQGFTNEITGRLLEAGERSARLASMLDFAAEHYERELAWQVERVTKVIEPALLIVVAGMIGLIVLLMYMPIFDLATALG